MTLIGQVTECVLTHIVSVSLTSQGQHVENETNYIFIKLLDQATTGKSLKMSEVTECITNTTVVQISRGSVDVRSFYNSFILGEYES